MNTVQEMTCSPLYNDNYLQAVAAHERTDLKVTDEMRKHDDDIMDDENFWSGWLRRDLWRNVNRHTMQDKVPQMTQIANNHFEELCNTK